MASSTPWTAEDFRRNASSWTLEGDAKLLEFMQKISENLEKRAQYTNSKISEMVLDSQETSVSLENVTNKLSALQHSQFVENRVYEEDETIANISEVPVEVQNDAEQYDPIETLSTVLKNSVSMMEKCYQKVSIVVEDSDDEEGLLKSIVYKPNNIFEQRPLPHIIGSREWKEKWHIGLCDTDDDYSDEENKDEYSDTSENVSLSASLPSNAPTMSESESSIWGLHNAANVKRPTIYSPSSEEEASSNALTSKTSGEVQRIKSNTKMVSPSTILPPQNERYYVHKPKEKGLFDESSDESENSNSQPQLVQQVPNKNKVVNRVSNIFNDEPPELDEVDKKDENENTQLFYESDNEVSKQNKSQKINQVIEEKLSNIRKKPVNLFDDDDFDSFMKELDKKTHEKLNQINTEKRVPNLFDDNSVEEPETVSTLSVPIIEKGEIKADLMSRNENKNSLFDTDPEENTFEKVVNKPRNVEIAAKLKVRNLFDESSDDDFESIFKTSSEVTNKIQNKSANGNDNNIANSTAIRIDSGLTTNVVSNDLDKINKALSNTNKAPSLFSDEQSESDDIFNDEKSQRLEVGQSSTNVEVKNGNKELLTSASIVSNVYLTDIVDDDDNLFTPSKRGPVPAPRTGFDINQKDDVSGRDKKSESADNKEQQSPIVSTTSSAAIVIESEKEKIRNESEDVSKNLYEDDIFNNNNNNEKTQIINIPKTGSDNNLEENGIGKPIKNSSNIFFDSEPPPDDSDDIFNISRKVREAEFNGTRNPNVQKKDLESTKSAGHSKENEIQEKSDITSVSNKFKLPSLFDDDVSDDEDFLFSTSNRSGLPISGNLPYSDKEKGDKLIKNKLGTLEKEKLGATPFSEVNLNEPNILKQAGDLSESYNINKQIHDISKQNIATNLVEKDDGSHIDVAFKTKETCVSISNNSKATSNRSEESGHHDSQFDENNCNKLAFSIDKEAEKSHNDRTDNSSTNENTVLNDQELSFDSMTNASTYSAINLFQDIPPEDDFQSPTDIKRLHNIFYDDFAETIPSTSSYPRKQSTTYFFSDEPPPDSFDDDTSNVPDNEPVSSPQLDQVNLSEEVDPEVTESVIKCKERDITSSKSEPDNRNLSVAELIKKADADQAYSKPKSSVPIPKKLNTNLDINVAALMPGAKMPNKLESQMSVEKDVPKSYNSEIKEKQEDYITSPRNNINYNSPEIDSDICRLPSLNKTRAKIQTKRRPSTRKGRQENYRKSLISDVVDGSSDEEAKTNKTKPAEIKSPVDSTNAQSQTWNLLQREGINQIEPVAETCENSTPKETAAVPIVNENFTQNITKSATGNAFVEESDDDIFHSSVVAPGPKNAPGLKQERPKEAVKEDTKMIKSLFQDDSDDDLFGKPQKSKVLNEKLNALSKVKTNPTATIFSSDEDDDDLFSKSFKASNKLDLKSEKHVPRKLAVPSSKSIFGDDDDDDDDDDLFSTAAAKSKGITRVVNIPKKSENKGALGSSTADNPLADLLNG